MEIHFPGFQGNSENQTNRIETNPKVAYKPRKWSLAAKMVYPREVEWAIKTFDFYKTPGSDGIYPILLQEGLNILLGSFTKVFSASIALKHILQVWSKIKVVFIPKPGKNGHVLAKDFRLISRLIIFCQKFFAYPLAALTRLLHHLLYYEAQWVAFVTGTG